MPQRRGRPAAPRSPACHLGRPLSPPESPARTPDPGRRGGPRWRDAAGASLGGGGGKRPRGGAAPRRRGADPRGGGGVGPRPSGRPRAGALTRAGAASAMAARVPHSAAVLGLAWRAWRSARAATEAERSRPASELLPGGRELRPSHVPRRPFKQELRSRPGTRVRTAPPAARRTARPRPAAFRARPPALAASGVPGTEAARPPWPGQREWTPARAPRGPGARAARGTQP